MRRQARQAVCESEAMPTISYARRVRNQADAAPSAPALTVVDDRTLSWRELVDESEVVARRLVAAGAAVGDLVTIAEPNSVEFVTALIACWMIGATPQPVSSKLPAREIREIVDLADPAVTIGVDATIELGRARLEAVDHVVGVELPDDVVSPSWKAPTSGGSTGRPKLILAGSGSTMEDDAVPGFCLPGGTMVMPGPLYHNGPLVWAVQQLLHAGHLVLLQRFDAAATLGAIERHAASSIYVVPTMMQRIWRLPDHVRAGHDVSSLRMVWHLAAPCPAWLKEEWISWLGPEKIFELYAGTEAQAATIITGSEWLEHRGSVGKPFAGEMKIVRDDGSDADPGEQGEVFMRPPDPDTPTYAYVGAESTRFDGGWESLGDMGWMDTDGYLYLGDRKKDMILSGGANIYPAEVEAAIDRHPRVVSCAVIGVDDDDLGQRIHAIVHADGEVTDDDLRVHLSEELVRYKIPRTFEFVDEPVRDDAGKVRRSALAADRSVPEP